MASKKKPVAKVDKATTKVVVKKTVKATAAKAAVAVKAKPGKIVAKTVSKPSSGKSKTSVTKPTVDAVKLTKAAAKTSQSTSKTSAAKTVVKALSKAAPLKTESMKSLAKAPAKSVKPSHVIKSSAVKSQATESNQAKPLPKSIQTPAPKKTASSVVSEAVSLTPYAPAKTEEYMNEAQEKHFKELLRVWRAALTTKIDTAVSHLKDEQKHFADLNDRATQEEEFNLELKARDREADLIAKIDEALKRLHEGDYGYCEECGVEIGTRRLEARPTATLCIDCKTLAEMRERQAGG